MKLVSILFLSLKEDELISPFVPNKNDGYKIYEYGVRMKRTYECT